MISEPEIPENWKLVPLKDIVQIQSGGRPTGSVDSYDSDIPSVGGSEIDGEGNVLLTDPAMIPQEYYDSMNTGVIQPRDILLVKDGKNTGDIAIINESMGRDLAVNSHVYILRINSNYDILYDFLGNYLMSPLVQKYIESHAKGAAQKGINMSFADELKVPVPPLEEQERIVEEIEERLDTINTLEHSINNIQQLSNEYEDSFLAALVTGVSNNMSVDSFMSEDSTPEGWDTKALSSIANVNPRLSLEDCDSYTYVPMDAVGASSQTIERFETREDLYSGLAKFENGDIIVARITPCFENGKMAIVKDVPSDQSVAVGSSEFVTIRPENINREYLFTYLKSPLVKQWGENRLMGATGRERIQISQFRDELYVPIPPEETQKEIVQRYKNTDFENIRQSTDSLERLFEEYKESVLSKAFSGNI